MMKRKSWQLVLAAACGALTVFGWAAPLPAADENPGGPADRLERLERRVNEMAQRQEQFMRRLGAQQERQAPMEAPVRERFRRQNALPGRADIGQLPPPPGGPAPAGIAPQPAPPVCPAKCCKNIAGLMGLFLLVAVVFNILVAVWIYTDIRKRGEGSAIFIALALLAGIPAGIIYALVRIGDKKP
jgi:hypothetical protein